MLKVKIFKVRLTEEFQAEDESLVNDFLESVKVVDVQSSVIHAPPEKFWTILIVYEEIEEAEKEALERISFDTSEPLTPDEEEIYMQLRGWRDMKAREENIPPYRVFHSSHLKALVKIHPRSLEDFLRIAGVSKKKIYKYGEEIIQLLDEMTET